jgi:hypothetical protein
MRQALPEDQDYIRKTWQIKEDRVIARHRKEELIVIDHMQARSTIPHKFWKRILPREEEKHNNTLRERQAEGDRAEGVIVRTLWTDFDQKIV